MVYMILGTLILLGCNYVFASSMFLDNLLYLSSVAISGFPKFGVTTTYSICLEVLELVAFLYMVVSVLVPIGTFGPPLPTRRRPAQSM